MIATDTCWQVFSVASLASRWGSRWEAWLHPQEAARASQLRDASRRQAWILGRIAARQLLLEQVCESCVCPRQIQIISENAARQGCAPRVIVEGTAQPWSLSLSHSRDWVAVALAVGGGTVGIDVVDLDTICPDRLAYFLGAGRCQIGTSRLATAVEWAVIESAFKSLGSQQPFQPGRFQLHLEGSAVAWRYTGPGGQWTGRAKWWQREQAIISLTEQTQRRRNSDLRQELAA